MYISHKFTIKESVFPLFFYCYEWSETIKKLQNWDYLHGYLCNE